MEEALRGERFVITTPEDRRKRVKDEVYAEVVTQGRIRELHHALKDAQKAWHLEPESLRLVLHEGLRLVRHPGLEPVEDGDLAGRAWLVRNLPAMWAECHPFIRDAKGRLLKLVFDEKHARDRKDVALVHLDHPLMKRALAVFRANLWSAGLHDSHQLARVTYRVLDDRELDRPVIILVSRLIATSTLGQKLHEELLYTGGEVQEERVTPLEGERLVPCLTSRNPWSRGVATRPARPPLRRGVRRQQRAEGELSPQPAESWPPARRAAGRGERPAERAWSRRPSRSGRRSWIVNSETEH